MQLLKVWLRRLTVITIVAAVFGIWHYTVTTLVDVRQCFASGPEAAKVTRITIHHDGNKDEVSLHDIDKFHAEVRGWSCGFAYHWYVTDGKVYHISNDKQIKAHTQGNNTGNIGICLNGDFDCQHPALSQQINLILLTNYLILEYQIDLEQIKGHRYYNGTSCPGNNFDLDTFKCYLIDIKKWNTLTMIYHQCSQLLSRL